MPVLNPSSQLSKTLAPISIWNTLRFWKSSKWATLRTSISASKNWLEPDPSVLFRPLALCPKPRVVILSERPYMSKGVNEADGLALSFKRVDQGKVLTQPFLFFCLKNSLREEENVDIGRKSDLEKWARQGILLWNTVPLIVKGASVSESTQFDELTKELVEQAYLYNNDTVFVFIGDASRFGDSLPEDAITIKVPSPTVKDRRLPIFRAIDKELRRTRQKPINWKV